MITIEEIQTLKTLQDKINDMAFRYYNEFLKCDHTYEFCGWELTEKENEIRIIYSYLNYLDEGEFDSKKITIDELNNVLL